MLRQREALWVVIQLRRKEENKAVNERGRRAGRARIPGVGVGGSLVTQGASGLGISLSKKKKGRENKSGTRVKAM